MPRLARYLGRWILHSGWYPDRKIRLYRREQGHVGRRFRARKRAACDGRVGTWRATSCTSRANRSPSTSRPWTATPRWRPRNWRRARMSVPLWRLIAGSAWTFLKSLLPAARLSGWPRRADHRLHGGVLHVPEIRQSEKHELMRVLHLDAGEGDARRPVAGAAADRRAGREGVESTLLARAGSPLFEAAQRGGWRVEPLGYRARV